MIQMFRSNHLLSQWLRCHCIMLLQEAERLESARATFRTNSYVKSNIYLIILCSKFQGSLAYAISHIEEGTSQHSKYGAGTTCSRVSHSCAVPKTYGQSNQVPFAHLVDPYYPPGRYVWPSHLVHEEESGHSHYEGVNDEGSSTSRRQSLISWPMFAHESVDSLSCHQQILRTGLHTRGYAIVFC